MNIPSELKYTDTHEWTRTEPDGSLTVGITDHAQELLGDLVFIELPKIGATFAAGQECAVVESVKAASDVYAPVAGTVAAVNEAVASKPEIVNTAPYDQWLFRIAPAQGAEASRLVDAAAYRALVEAES
jgi:glycine cleavage system H protein